MLGRSSESEAVLPDAGVPAHAVQRSDAAQRRSEEAVLGEVLVNQGALRHATSGGQHVEADEDLALAKMLQEQERAFLMISGAGSAARRVENVPPAAEADAGGAPAAGAAPMTDEELAWELMQQEEADFQQRLLAMAGAAPDEGGDVNEGGTDDGPDPDAMSYEALSALGEVVGTVSTGLTPAQMAALEVSTYPQCRAGGGNGGAGEDEEQCAVCRVEYEAGEGVTLLRCAHFYHSPCIAQWLAHKNTCPQCNKDVVASAAAAQPAPIPADVLGPRRQ